MSFKWRLKLQGKNTYLPDPVPYSQREECGPLEPCYLISPESSFKVEICNNQFPLAATRAAFLHASPAAWLPPVSAIYKVVRLNREARALHRLILRLYADSWF